MFSYNIYIKKIDLLVPQSILDSFITITIRSNLLNTLCEDLIRLYYSQDHK